jgi:predicted DNA-binding transcriptional regulator AlpA
MPASPTSTKSGAFPLALESRLLGGNKVPFGLDKLGTAETASYIGVQPETLRDKVKRRHLGLPAPYAFARKLFWRRSELDAWIEAQRPTKLSELT